MKLFLLAITSILLTGYSISARAWFFIFPIPNLAKPPALQKLIDALEKSSETKAVAYVSENKTFGTKQWIWGHHTNGTTQKITEELAMQKCESALSNMKSQTVGGQPLYDFGDNKCELYTFSNPHQNPITENKDVSSARPKVSPVEEKLIELKNLRDKNLITQEEYDQKRQELLKSL